MVTLKKMPTQMRNMCLGSDSEESLREFMDIYCHLFLLKFLMLKKGK